MGDFEMSGKPKHGLSYTPEYRAWQTMRLRCTEPANRAYKDYGARGISVCDRWINSVTDFVFDMGLKPSPGHELDRKDNDQGYSPENCRWVTRKVNDRNRRSNRFLEFGGETLTVAEWAERYDIRPDTLKDRIDSGWDVARAITEPARAKSPNGHTKSRTPCGDCGTPAQGKLCRACENKSRRSRLFAAPASSGVGK